MKRILEPAQAPRAAHRLHRGAAPAAGDAVRPTSDRAREALFNILSHGSFAAVGAALCRAAGARRLRRHRRARPRSLVARRQRGRLYRERTATRWRRCAATSRARRRGPRPDCRGDATRPRARRLPAPLAFLDPPYGSGLAGAGADARSPRPAGSPPMRWRWSRSRQRRSSRRPPVCHDWTSAFTARRGWSSCAASPPRPENRMTDTLPRVTLPDGESVPAFGLGTWHMGEDRRRAADEAAALKLGIELGMTLIDTAEMYGNGGAEEIVARGHRRPHATGSSSSARCCPTTPRAKATIEACERSLKRLKTDRIDLYLLHWRGSVPLAETLAGVRHAAARRQDPASRGQQFRHGRHGGMGRRSPAARRSRPTRSSTI